MRFFLTALVAAAALVPSTGARAQTVPAAPTETLAPSSAQHSSDWQNRRPNASFQNEYNSKILLKTNPGSKDDYASARRVAECLHRKSDAASGLIGGPMTADEDFAALTKALSGRFGLCVDRQAEGISMALVNGALAEELVLERHQDLEPRAMAVNVTEAEAFYRNGQSPTIDSVARCLAIYSPGLAKAVFAASPHSLAEQNALATLYAGSPECGNKAPPENIPAEEQRSALASGLYLWLSRS